MTKIQILTSLLNFPVPAGHLFPLIKFEKQINKEDIKILFSSQVQKVKRMDGDILILESRFFQRFDKEEVIQLCIEFRRSFTRIFWFDTVDPSGSDSFWIMPYIDVFLKKQVLKDKSFYSENYYDESVRCWVKLDTKNLMYPDYVPCDKQYLNKIRVGWNIGLNDYAVLPKVAGIVNSWTAFFKPSVVSPFRKREIDLTFRGQISYNNPQIAVQRNKTIQKLEKIEQSYIFRLGNRISKQEYISELRNSKLSISPFGWGEVCYRDFESILAGCVLLKPNMDHLDTFPSVYKSEEYYLPLTWDLDDLEEKIEVVLENYDFYREMAVKCQKDYFEILNEPNFFVSHFKEIIR